jgi:hypothetical protein
MHYLFHFSSLSDRRQMVLFVHEYYRRFFNSEEVIIYFISLSLAREDFFWFSLFMNLAGGFSILKESLSVSFIFP